MIAHEQLWPKDNVELLPEEQFIEGARQAVVIQVVLEPKGHLTLMQDIK